MASVTVGAHVTARNNLGRFMARTNAAIIAALEEVSQEGADVARAAAPRKTGALADSIQGVMLSDRSAALVVGTDHWRFQEDGTRPHPITGNVMFWWESQGRPWFPGSNTINHPGNPARHFLLAGKEQMRGKLARAIKENM